MLLQDFRYWKVVSFGITDSNWRVCVTALACINRIIERNMQADCNVQLIFHRNPSKLPLMKCLSPENMALGLQKGKNLTKVKSRGRWGTELKGGDGNPRLPLSLPHQ